MKRFTLFAAMLVAMISITPAFGQSPGFDGGEPVTSEPIPTGLFVLDDSTVLSLDFPEFTSGSLVGTIAPDFGQISIDDLGEILYEPSDEWMLDEFFVVVNTEDEGIQFLAGYYDPVEENLHFGWPDQVEVTDPEIDDSPDISVATFQVTSPLIDGYGIWTTEIVVTADADGYELIAFQEEDESGHTTNRTPSNREKHENGDTRRDVDKGGEKGDAKRRPVGKRPKGHKGPWPPTNKPKPPKSTGPKVKVNKYPKIKVLKLSSPLGTIADTLEHKEATGKSFLESFFEVFTAPLRYDGYSKPWPGEPGYGGA